MIADHETFNELTAHLKRASDALLRTALHLAMLCGPDVEPEESSVRALDELIVMATEMAAMERILRALMVANHAEEAARQAGKLSGSAA